MIRSRELLAPLTDASFGDEVSLFDGSTRFGVTDVSIPGNNGLPVEFRRTWDPQNQGLSQQVVGDWTIDAPNISGLFVGTNGWPEQRCTQAAAPPTITLSSPPNYLVLPPSNYFNGYHVEVNGARDSMLLVQTTNAKLPVPAASLGATSPWTTKDSWHFSCLSSLQRGAGEGFVGFAPDGKRYTFDWTVTDSQRPMFKKGVQADFAWIIPRTMIRIYATKVEDRFGNWVRYSWSGDRLMRIYSSDSREITLSYGEDGRLATVSANGRTWYYRYKPYAIPQVDQFYLSEVEQPDGNKWLYDTSNFVRRILYRKGSTSDMRDGDGYLLQNGGYCNFDRVIIGGGGVYTVTQPSGAKAAYTFTPMRHGRQNVRERCIDGRDYSKGGTNLFPLQHDALSITGKAISGPGIQARNYTYSYAGLDPGYEMTSDPTWNSSINATPTPHFKTVTLTDPDGDQHVSVFGRDSNLNEGLLFREETRRGGTVTRAVSYEYVSDAEVGAYPFAGTVGQSMAPHDNRFMSTDNRPVKKTVVSQDGTDFTSLVNAFDSFARPVSVVKFSSAPGEAPAVTSVVAPPAPVSPGAYVLTWAAQTGVDHYVVEQQSADGQWVEVYRGTDTQWAASLSAATTNNFRVKSCSFYGACSVSQTVTVIAKAIDLTPILQLLLD
ncbi:hypothetical protein [Cognatilysobacter terrigena]|uniref:hypothetical protein n=1 Tax=Cognatilysobacter terrigena TaxID=2488749 RepID=UPI00105DF10B|nr:hypothetical protein [Lysobacter terrigena]